MISRIPADPERDARRAARLIRMWRHSLGFYEKLSGFSGHVFAGTGGEDQMSGRPAFIVCRQCLTNTAGGDQYRSKRNGQTSPVRLSHAGHRPISAMAEPLRDPQEQRCKPRAQTGRSANIRCARRTEPRLPYPTYSRPFDRRPRSHPCRRNTSSGR